MQYPKTFKVLQPNLPSFIEFVSPPAKKSCPHKPHLQIPKTDLADGKAMFKEGRHSASYLAAIVKFYSELRNQKLTPLHKSAGGIFFKNGKTAQPQ
jgi:hypothetical protein